MPMRTIVDCFRPAFYDHKLLRDAAWSRACSHLLMVCLCVAFPLLLEFGSSHNVELWQYDMARMVELVERHTPELELHIVDGEATFWNAYDDSSAEAGSPDVKQRATDGVRVEFPMNYYNAFLDKGDALHTYVTDFLIQTLLTTLDSAWENVPDYHLATPMEFSAGEQVEVRHKSTWVSATVVEAEVATKLNRFNC
eukprot:SAG11_NODE_346_length_10432_cov_4.883770_2_plen_196_part_00